MSINMLAISPSYPSYSPEKSGPCQTDPNPRTLIFKYSQG